MADIYPMGAVGFAFAVAFEPATGNHHSRPGPVAALDAILIVVEIAVADDEHATALELDACTVVVGNIGAGKLHIHDRRMAAPYDPDSFPFTGFVPDVGVPANPFEDQAVGPPDGAVAVFPGVDPDMVPGARDPCRVRRCTELALRPDP